MNRHALLVTVFALALVCAAGLWTGADAGQAEPESTQTQTDFRVELKSRQFVPEAGVDAAFLADASGATGGRVHVLIQLWDIPTEARAADLEQIGVRLLDYVPDRAWFASVPVDFSPDAASHGFLRWIGPVKPEDKASARVRNLEFEDWATDDQGRVYLAVRLFSDADASPLRLAVDESGGVLQDTAWSIDTHILAIYPELAMELASLDGVQWVDQVSPPWQELNNQVRSVMHVEDVWGAPYNLNGSGVKVFVFDGDVVFGSHPDFGSRVTEGEPGGSNWEREHPTHVAGTIGGAGSVNATYKGMAPAVTFYSLRFDWTDPIFYNNPADTEASYSAALSQGCHVANNSIGSNIAYNGYNCDWEGDYEGSAALIDGIVRGSLGTKIVVFWAAGNERGGWWCWGDYRMIAPPAAAKNSIVVGAVNSNDNSMTDFSSWGPTDDGRLKPDIVAPGCQSGGDSGVTSTVPVNGYDNMCGTSMASPAAAGVGALLVQQWKRIFTGRPFSSTIKATLAQTAVDLGNNGPDYRFGFGRVDAKEAVDLMREYGVMEDSVTTGQTLSYQVNLASAGPIRITLAWDDYPGTPNVNPNLVNNLDLSVVGPNDATYLPYVLNPSIPSQTASTGVNSRDNLEQVYVSNAPAGSYQIRIIGTAVPRGPQNFSLAGPLVAQILCDQDGDTYLGETCDGDDCNDNDPDIYPGAPERCNGIDDDCSGAPAADEADADEDGYMICEDDCDDGDPDTHPDAEEICGDDKDNDCDGDIDEGCGDDDDDDSSDDDSGDDDSGDDDAGDDDDSGDDDANLTPGEGGDGCGGCS